MKQLLLYSATLLAALCSSFAARAQPEHIKFGKVEPKELSGELFTKDSAAAVVLCDYATSRMEGSTTGGQMVFERITRIKILKKAGFDWATVEVPLFGSGEKMTNLKGFTYNLVNGEVVKEKLENDGKYVEDLTKHIRIRKFTMPNVREGSVIEFSYHVVSQYFADLRDWQFQTGIPVRWSEYRVSYPEYFDYKILVQGYLPLDVREMKNGQMPFGNNTAVTREYRWVMKDVPAFVEEPFITSSRDYMARIDFELASVQFPNSPSQNFTGTWEKVDKTLMESESFGMQLDRGGFLKEELAKLPPVSTSNLQTRIAAVHALVRDAVKHNDNDGIFTSNSLRKTYQELRRGSAADINLLLIAALRAAQIESNPVLLSTRDHGRLNMAFPLVSRFNYVVAHVQLSDGQEMLLDATEPLLPAGMLPERCLSQAGRLVMKNTLLSRWVDIKPAHRRVHFQQVHLALTPEGTLQGKVHEEYGGYLAAHVRTELGKLGESKYRSEFAGKHSGWTVPKFAISDRETLSKPLALDYEFTQSSDESGATPGTLYLSLLDEFGTSQNPFRHAARSFPVDFGTAQEETIMVTLSLPSGYELAELPKATIVDLPNDGGRYLFNVNGSGNSLQMTSRLNLRKPVYSAEEYEHLREFYRLMLEKQAEKLVIKKKA